MGFVPFHGRRIGFWMAERTAAPELPPGTTPQQEGERIDGGASLVLVALDPDDSPAWSWLVHAADGASLLCVWGEWLLAGVGGRTVFLDAQGQRQGGYEVADDEFVSAWPLETGLLLIARRGVHLLGPDGQRRWVRPLEGDGFHFLSADAERITLAVMGPGDDWREVRLSAVTGELLDQAGG